MIHVIHGDDSAASREYFSKQKTSESITYDAENLSLVELAQTLQGSGLFGGGSTIFIENLFSRKAKNVTQTLELLSQYSKENEIYAYSNKLLPAKSIKELKSSEDVVFKIPQTIWAYVDGIKPNSPSNLSLFHNALSANEAEYVFSMLIRQFRLLLGLGSSIDDVKRLAPWQKSKLERQLSSFGGDKVKNIHKQLYKIDRQQKTGGSNLTLTQQIDMLMLSI